MSDDDWKEAMREIREMTIVGDMASIKRRVFDLILDGPNTKVLKELTSWDHITKSLPMPDDLVVVLNRDPDEAGDYRVMTHAEAVNNPDWTICPDIKPEDLD